MPARPAPPAGGLGPLDPLEPAGVTSTPYAIRLDRHAAAGLSQVGSPQRAGSLAHLLLGQAGVAQRGHRPRSAAAAMPGRNPATASSALVPVATTARPSRPASGASVSSSSALQKSQRSPALAR